jgi:catalase
MQDGRAPVESSPALSLMNQPKPGIRSRKVALLALPGVSKADVDAICTALCGQGAKVEVVSDALGLMPSDEDRPVDVDKSIWTVASVLYDAVVVPGGASAKLLVDNARAVQFVREAFHHAKPIGATNEGVALLRAAALPGVELAASKGGRGVVDSKGVVSASGSDLEPFTKAFIEAIREHRTGTSRASAPENPAGIR